VFTNHSDVETIVKTKLESKVVEIDPAIITIEPKGKTTATLRFLPRKNNPHYCKEITCLNAKNRKNSIVVRVESTNIDMGSFPYHTYFYKLFAFSPSGKSNFAILHYEPAVVYPKKGF
jgi:hypothetical protein